MLSFVVHYFSVLH